MKQVISISLGSSANNYEFQATFLGQKFNLRRFGTNGDYDKAVDLLVQLDAEADAFGLGSVKLPSPNKHNMLMNMASNFVPKGLHIQSKAETFTVEGYNSLFRHFLTRMRRKSKCYSKSIEMLKYSVILLMLKWNQGI